MMRLIRIYRLPPPVPLFRVVVVVRVVVVLREGL
jgi:hypothetical protein